MGSKPCFALRSSYTSARASDRGGLTRPGVRRARDGAWKQTSSPSRPPAGFCVCSVQPGSCVGSASPAPVGGPPYLEYKWTGPGARLAIGAAPRCLAPLLFASRSAKIITLRTYSGKQIMASDDGVCGAFARPDGTGPGAVHVRGRGAGGDAGGTGRQTPTRLPGTSMTASWKRRSSLVEVAWK